MRLCDVKKAHGGIVTTDGTVTTIVSFDPTTELPVPFANAGLHVEGVLIAKDGSNNVASVRVARGFKIIAGALSALGTQASVVAVGIGDAGLATIAATLDAQSTVIRLRATGIAATTITWSGFIWLSSGEF